MKNFLSVSFFLIFFIAPSMRLSAQYDSCDAVYLFISKEFTLNPDGSMDYRYIKKQKLQTYRSFHNLYGETFIVFDPRYQQLKINEVYTIMKDGKKIIGPANAINEVLPGYAANAPAYNALREMVVTHTGLERGAIVNLDYQIHTMKDFFPALMGNEVLPEIEPIRELKIKIRIPTGNTLSYRFLNITDPVIKTIEKGYQVYSWTFTNLPAISAEESQTGGNEQYPRLLFSCGGSQGTSGFETDAAMKKEIGKLKAETTSPIDILMKLQDRVVNDLRLYPVPFRISGYKSRTAVETWNSNGGTPVEKTILLTALLREAGIKANPVLIARSGFLHEKEDNLATIEDFAVRVELKEEGTLYVSATNTNPQDLLKTLPDRIFIILNNDEKPAYIKSGDPEFKAEIQGTFLCSSDPKITGEISFSLTAAANPFLCLLRDKNKIRNSLSGGISGADMKEAKISNSIPQSTFQTFTVQAEKPFRKDSLFYFFNLPFLSSGIESWGIHTLSSKRETPYEIPALAEENYDYSLVLPEGISVLTPLQKIIISNNAGTFILDLRLEKGKLIIKKCLRFKERIIKPGNYPDFKILMDSWNNPRNREIVFRKGN